MNTEQHRDWQALENLWREQPAAAPVPDEIRRRVRGQERRMRIYTLFEWLVAVALCTYAVAVALDSALPDVLLRTLIVFALVAWALHFSAANRQGLWCPPEESTQAYLDLAILRLQRKRRGIRFAWLLFLVELVIFALWQLAATLGWLQPPFALDSNRALWWILAAAALLVAWSLFVWLRAGREEQELAQLREQNEKACKE